jgi:hypothetical protein
LNGDQALTVPGLIPEQVREDVPPFLNDLEEFLILLVHVVKVGLNIPLRRRWLILSALLCI